MPTHREMFRRKALEYYQQGSVANVYPHFFSFRRVLVCWVLLLLFAGLVLAAWSWNIAQFTQGSGIIQHMQGKTSMISVLMLPGSQDQAVATLFFSSQFRKKVQVGDLVMMRIQGVSQPVKGTIESFDPAVLNAEEASQRYHLSTQITSGVDYPAMVAFVGVSSVPISAISHESRVDASIQIGTLNLFSLF